MFKLYEPTDTELEMLKYKAFLICSDDYEDQDNVLGCAVRAVLDFDYYYHFSDSLDVWKQGEEELDRVIKLISLIKDKELQTYLTACFNKENHNKVFDKFQWASYINIQSKYVSYRFSGMSDEEACYKVGLYNWINDIINMVHEHQCCYRALYSDNVFLANKVLKEGLYWFDDTDPIKPLTVPVKLWNELSALGNLYKSNSVKFVELKELFPYNVSVMLDSRMEVLKINTFYMLFTY